MIFAWPAIRTATSNTIADKTFSSQRGYRAADVIVVLSLSSAADAEQGCGSRMTVEALRWVATQLQVRCIYDIAWMPIVSSFYLSRVPRKGTKHVHQLSCKSSKWNAACFLSIRSDFVRFHTMLRMGFRA